MKEKRPLKLVREIGTYARLELSPWVASIRPTTDSPYRGSACNRKQNIEECRQGDMRYHWYYQSFRHPLRPSSSTMYTVPNTTVNAHHQ